MNAISYTRFSHRKQIGNDSFRRQTEATERYCKEHGLKLNTRLEDLGISGWDKSNLDDTAALGRFLKLVNDGKIPVGTVLICENLDRLTRAGIFDALNLFSNILKAGIDIVTTMDNKRYSYESVKNNVGELIISITYLTRGNNESETKSIRVKESWVRRHNQIKNNKFAKFHCPSWIEHNGKEYNLIKENVYIIEFIFELYVKGYGVYSLIQELNKRRIKPFTKTNRWTAVFLHELLQNPAVIGTNRLVEPPVKHYYPAAISEELFYKSLAQREKNRNFKGRTGHNAINIFSGLCKCEKCGGSMVKFTSKSKAGTPYHALCCSNAKTGDCSYKMTPFPKFEASFFCILDIANFAKALTANSNAPEKDRTSFYEGKLAEINKTINRIADAVLKSNSASLVERLTVLEETKTDLQKSLKEEMMRRASRIDVKAEFDDMIEKLNKEWNDNNFRLRLRLLMRDNLERIVCNGNEYEVFFKNADDTIRVCLDNDKNFSVSLGRELEFESYTYGAFIKKV